MENQTAENGKSARRSLSKKMIRVDMTPLVDLGFLLITFFMFTTNFSKPNIVDLGFPAGEGGTEINYKNQITFILGKENRIFYYQAEAGKLIEEAVRETQFTGSAVANIISAYKKAAPNSENFTVIIKPTDDSKYRNFVDMLDEMALSKSERYGIAELNTQEESVYKELLK